MLFLIFKVPFEMKRKIFLALFPILVFLLPLDLRGEVVDRIVALVNGEIITLSELEQMGKPYYDQVSQTSTAGEREEKIKKARMEVLGRLIENRLLEEEMKKRKIEVPERDVDATIQDVLKSSKLTENDMKKALAREGMTYSTYRQRVRDELGKMRLVSREIKSKIVIEDVVLRDYYQKNLEKFTDPLEVKIQQIFFPVPERASQEETAAVEREARPILERARRGEDFAELARKFSKGPEAGDGGLLGYFKHRELMPELEEAGFKLRPGEISDLVRSPAGFHILRVLERKGGEPRPFAEVQFKIREELSEAEAQKKFEQWMKELKSKAYIEIRL
jgi:peptidyl-prolyl cis-trans isomerase SurA